MTPGMTPLLQQFLSEARDFLEGIGEKVMQLEDRPDDPELMTVLFRLVHTLKGNSGLFEFREMTRVLHAAESLMDDVRGGRVAYSKELADRLLDAMDFVGKLCDEIEREGHIGAGHAVDSARLAESLERLVAGAPGAASEAAAAEGSGHAVRDTAAASLAEVPEAVRRDAHRRAGEASGVHWIDYCPVEECYFAGEDPLFQARGTPDLLWGSITARQPWPSLAELDAYRCVLAFRMLSAAPRAELDEYYRYMPDQVRVTAVPAAALLASLGPPGVPDPVAPRAPDALVPAELAALAALFAVQRAILNLPVAPGWQLGRLEAVAAALTGCVRASGDVVALTGLAAATATALAERASAPLVAWLDGHGVPPERASAPVRAAAASAPPGEPPRPAADPDLEIKFGRRAEDQAGGTRSLKVDQAKIDRLVNLIGEMVVSKNALPYLAGRAETVFGVRELSREIEAQYAVINRIAEEMQDAIMAVSMMPVAFVFQRFPRLVRDISRKLGKEVTLVLQGEDTEADKTIIECLGDPLVHIVRNSLGHGIEQPEARRAAGKPAAGTITIRASQAADRVVIEIRDDGRGIDPMIIKRKAYERGLIDESDLERLTDQEAVNLIFASGFSTAEVVSDLSGRGVGMDVVRAAVEKVHGSLAVDSEVGKGTCVRLSLPLSMAVTRVMIVESDGQRFGMPMDCVVETVRVPRCAIHTVKHSQAAVLRGRTVPLKPINSLLGLGAAPRANADGELAVLVVRQGDDWVGLIVDELRDAADVILKPITGVLAGLSAYSGSALMGDGSVLMVLNAKELM